MPMQGVYFSVESYKKIREEMEKEGKSFSQIVREALDLYFKFKEERINEA